MTRWHVALPVLFLAMSALAAPCAVAADDAFCEEYARTALQQGEVARDLPVCARFAHGTRWSPDYRFHYEWCRAASYHDARAQQDARRGTLDTCRHGTH